LAYFYTSAVLAHDIVILLAVHVAEPTAGGPAGRCQTNRAKARPAVARRHAKVADAGREFRHRQSTKL
jgi:hypothetical protein